MEHNLSFIQQRIEYIQLARLFQRKAEKQNPKDVCAHVCVVVVKIGLYHCKAQEVVGCVVEKLKNLEIRRNNFIWIGRQNGGADGMVCSLRIKA